MPSDSSVPRRWLDDILYHIQIANEFVGSIAYDSFKNESWPIWVEEKAPPQPPTRPARQFWPSDSSW